MVKAGADKYEGIQSLYHEIKAHIEDGTGDAKQDHKQYHGEATYYSPSYKEYDEKKNTPMGKIKRELESLRKQLLKSAPSNDKSKSQNEYKPKTVNVGGKTYKENE